jgi:hypothetical protein
MGNKRRAKSDDKHVPTPPRREDVIGRLAEAFELRNRQRARLLEDAEAAVERILGPPEGTILGRRDAVRVTMQEIREAVKSQFGAYRFPDCTTFARLVKRTEGIIIERAVRYGRALGNADCRLDPSIARDYAEAMERFCDGVATALKWLIAKGEERYPKLGAVVEEAANDAVSGLAAGLLPPKCLMYEILLKMCSDDPATEGLLPRKASELVSCLYDLVCKGYHIRNEWNKTVICVASLPLRYARKYGKHLPLEVAFDSARGEGDGWMTLAETIPSRCPPPHAETLQQETRREGERQLEDLADNGPAVFQPIAEALLRVCRDESGRLKSVTLYEKASPQADRRLVDRLEDRLRSQTPATGRKIQVGSRLLKNRKLLEMTRLRAPKGTTEDLSGRVELLRARARENYGTAVGRRQTSSDNKSLLLLETLCDHLLEEIGFRANPSEPHAIITLPPLISEPKWQINSETLACVMKELADAGHRLTRGQVRKRIARMNERLQSRGILADMKRRRI